MRGIGLFLALTAMAAGGGTGCRLLPRAGTREPGRFPVGVTHDFPARDRLPQTDVPPDRWYGEGMSSWGPAAAAYPGVGPPEGCDSAAWKRARILAVAGRYVGLRYRHHHIPAWDPPNGGPGLDCSNFAAWVYNYGLGIRFTSDVKEQAAGPLAPGRRLARGEPFAAGDLLFILHPDRSEISHVAIFVDKGHVIDSRNGNGDGAGVRLRPFTGWYRSHLSHARRVIE